MRVLTWNINGLGPTVRNIVLKHKSLRGFFDSHEADIVGLQEVKLPDNKVTQEVACVPDFESFWAVSREKQGYSGVTTYVKLEYSAVSAEIDCLGSGFDDIDREGRVVLTDHVDFVLVNVYVPNAGDRPERARLGFKLRFLRALQDKLNSLTAAGRQVVVVGDLNIAAEPRDVHSTISYEKAYSREEVVVLHELLASFPDVWRWLHPDTQDCFTVWDEKTSARAFNAGLRIDYVLCSPALLHRVASCEIVSMPPKWSDHAAVLLDIRDVPAVPRHPPCALSSLKMKRFNDSSQPSISALFGKKRPAPEAQADTVAKRLAVQQDDPEAAAGLPGGQLGTAPGDSADAEMEPEAAALRSTSNLAVQHSCDRAANAIHAQGDHTKTPTAEAAAEAVASTGLEPGSPPASTAGPQTLSACQQDAHQGSRHTPHTSHTPSVAGTVPSSTGTDSMSHQDDVRQQPPLPSEQPHSDVAQPCEQLAGAVPPMDTAAAASRAVDEAADMAPVLQDVTCESLLRSAAAVATEQGGAPLPQEPPQRNPEDADLPQQDRMQEAVRRDVSGENLPRSASAVDGEQAGAGVSHDRLQQKLPEALPMAMPEALPQEKLEKPSRMPSCLPQELPQQVVQELLLDLPQQMLPQQMLPAEPPQELVQELLQILPQDEQPHGPPQEGSQEQVPQVLPEEVPGELPQELSLGSGSQQLEAGTPATQSQTSKVSSQRNAAAQQQMQRGAKVTNDKRQPGIQKFFSKQARS